MAQKSMAKTMTFVAQVEIAESRENDTTGNALTLFNELIVPVISIYTSQDAFIVYAENNSAERYALAKMVFIGNSQTNVIGTGSVLRNTRGVYTIRIINTQTSAYCSQGTVLKIYKLDNGV